MRRQPTPEQLSKPWPRRLYRLEFAGEGADRAEYLLPTPGTARDRDLFHGFGVEDDRASLAVALAALPSLEGRGKDSLSEPERGALVRFATNWGLLGLFHQSLVLQRYIPNASGWVRALHGPPCGHPEVFESLSEVFERPAGLPEGESLGEEDWAHLAEWEQTTDARGEVWARVVGGVTLPMQALAPLPQFYRRFFPTLPADGPFPHFGHPEFWDHYAEDLGSVLVTVRSFQRTFRMLAGPPESLEWVRRELRPFLASVHPGFSVRADGTAAMAWEFPSLLSVAYFQLYHRLLAGRFPRFCRNPRCRAGFVPQNHRRLHCSPACENNAVQQRNKLRREVRELARAAGWSEMPFGAGHVGGSEENWRRWALGADALGLREVLTELRKATKGEQR